MFASRVRRWVSVGRRRRPARRRSRPVAAHIRGIPGRAASPPRRTTTAACGPSTSSSRRGRRRRRADPARDRFTTCRAVAGRAIAEVRSARCSAYRTAGRGSARGQRAGDLPDPNDRHDGGRDGAHEQRPHQLHAAYAQPAPLGAVRTFPTWPIAATSVARVATDAPAVPKRASVIALEDRCPWRPVRPRHTDRSMGRFRFGHWHVDPKHPTRNRPAFVRRGGAGAARSGRGVRRRPRGRRHRRRRSSTRMGPTPTPRSRRSSSSRARSTRAVWVLRRAGLLGDATEVPTTDP